VIVITYQSNDFKYANVQEVWGDTCTQVWEGDH